jgi:hypothetical protein
MFARLPIAAIVLLGAATAAMGQAQPAQKNIVTAATPTPDDRARQWLVLVDDKNYAQSWSEASKTFQERQKTDAWVGQAQAKRAPLGAVVSRDLKTIDLSRNNTAIVSYDSVFAHRAAAVETVTLAFENGSWAVTAYAID